MSDAATQKTSFWGIKDDVVPTNQTSSWQTGQYFEHSFIWVWCCQQDEVPGFICSWSLKFCQQFNSVCVSAPLAFFSTTDSDTNTPLSAVDLHLSVFHLEAQKSYSWSLDGWSPTASLAGFHITLCALTVNSSYLFFFLASSERIMLRLYGCFESGVTLISLSPISALLAVR